MMKAAGAVPDHKQQPSSHPSDLQTRMLHRPPLVTIATSLSACLDGVRQETGVHVACTWCLYSLASV